MNNLNTELHYQVALGQALERLQSNPDFRKVISEGYIVDVLMNESQGMLDMNPAFRQESLEKIQSVNYLRQYLTTIKNVADGAAQDIQAGN